LEEDLETNLNEGQLRLFEKLVPKLSTEPGTKYIRGFNELVETLATDAEALGELARVLKKLGWLRECTVYKEPYVEWTSDYLAERTLYLQNRSRAISLRRLLNKAMDQARSTSAELAPQKSPTDTPWIEASTVETLEALYMNPADFATISEGEGLLREIGPVEVEFLFVAALEHGTHMSLWYQRACRSGVDVWQILRDRIVYGEAQSPQVKNALQLLGELRDRQALELLRLALKQPDLGLMVLEVLGEVRTSEAVELLRDAVQQDALAVRAVDVLRRMCTKEAIALLGEVLAQKGKVALHAGMALKRVAGGRPSEASSQAYNVLTGVLAKQAEPLFLQALAQGLDVRLWFEEASRRGVDVWGILARQIADDVPIGQAENAIRLLSVLASEPATKLLAGALQEPRLSPLTEAILAETATKEAVKIWESLAQRENLASLSRKRLESIAKSETAATEVRDAARQVLLKREQVQGKSLAPPENEPRPKRPAEATVHKGPGESVWDALLDRIALGRCTPVLGAGANPGGLSLGSEVASRMAQEFGYPLEDSFDLARVSQFVATVRDPMFPKEWVANLVKRQTERVDISAPDAPLGVLAGLPFPVYITTTYDDLMARALADRGKSPARELCRWNKYIKHTPSIFDPVSGFEPSPERPVVFHLYGHDEVPESLVLTEDDYVSFLVNISRQQNLLPPWIKRVLAGTSLLLIGHRLTGWDSHILFQGLLGAVESSLRRINVAVVLAENPQQSAYLTRHLERFGMQVYWGTPGEFAAELHHRWERFSK
jgi:hypothetical protein